MEIDWSGIANTITAVKNWFTHRFVHRTIVKVPSYRVLLPCYIRAIFLGTT